LQLSHSLTGFFKSVRQVKQVANSWLILVPTVFRDENFYTFFIKKLFTFFLTLYNYVGQHKDRQA